MRVGNAQPCPAWMVNPNAADAANFATSEPANTMLGDLPPSSNKTFFKPSAACPMIFLPTKSDPVNEIMSTASWVVRCSPAATSPVTTFSTPGGSPASSAISPSTNASSGVNGDGFSTTVFPIASAGTTFDRLRYSGKLNGVIAATTPIGSLTITPCPSPRRAHRSVDVHHRGLRHLPDHVFRRGVDHVDRLVARRVNPVTTDVQPVAPQRRCHSHSPVGCAPASRFGDRPERLRHQPVLHVAVWPLRHDLAGRRLEVVVAHRPRRPLHAGLQPPVPHRVEPGLHLQRADPLTDHAF